MKRYFEDWMELSFFLFKLVVTILICPFMLKMGVLWSIANFFVMALAIALIPHKIVSMFKKRDQEFEALKKQIEASKS